jgi:choline dehydrogenase-like flavoprotein
MSAAAVTFATRTEVDFVIIGSGASGGVLAKELSVAGFDVVVLEQGPYCRTSDFTHDELKVFFGNELMNHPVWRDPQTFRTDETGKSAIAQATPPALYARTVGGSSVHFSGNYWRLRPVDFTENTLLGPIDGTGFSDWPLSYEELEPYYTEVDWQIGVSGAPGPRDPYRSRPYPLPPMPVKSSGVLLEKGAIKCGLHPQVAPVAVLSQPFNGRPACVHCGFCLAFGCEVNAKSSTLAAMIPLAEASGHCEIRPLSTVFRVETNDRGRVSEVVYRDAQGMEQAQKTKALIVAANGAETPRLLLLSASSRFPDGLANGSGLVGKYLMANAHSVLHAEFEHPLNDFKSVQCSRMVTDFYDSDPRRGFYGGGCIDARPYLTATPIMSALDGIPPGSPRWGAEYKSFLARNFTHHMAVLGSATSLPLERNNVSLDPDVSDEMGRPALRITYRDHENDLAMAGFLQDRAEEIMQAAGALRTWREPVTNGTVLAHLLGTCRMGNEPASSVVDRYHRSHEVANLFICDGSSLVTSGRGQPTMTIQALAFRAADHIAEFARRGAI